MDRRCRSACRLKWVKKGVRSDRSSTEEKKGHTAKNFEVRFGRDRVGKDQESVSSEGQYMLNELKIKTDKD